MYLLYLIHILLSVFFSGTPILHSHASEDEKNRAFHNFKTVAESLFQNYEVLYLKGISIPKKYEDLLKPEKSNYSSVTWLDTPPSTNNFSLVAYQLSEEQSEEHARDIRESLTNAVLGWMTNSS